ncbi:MAG TPA: polysaccharide deacetylase [Holosporales bacterium]|nr:polysaccharide deacetylase [Holosporales bacterium]
MNIFFKIANRINPEILWSLYAYKARKILPHSYFILSFDCDTEEDIAVAWEVHQKLQNIGITPVYAVPGALLKKGEKIYRKIYETGVEFINHGGCEHTYFDQKHKRHASCFFYDQQSQKALREDIFLGHETLQNILGVKAKGWRTPHFGTFQKPEDYKFLYSILNELGYSFSTSTCPVMNYRHGPLYRNMNMIEIPVTGIYSEPFNIMDTWAYFAEPNRTKLPSEYMDAAETIAGFAIKQPILINIYGDPSHVHDKPEFFEAMTLLMKAAENINYTHLIEKTYENIRTI